MPVKRLGEVAQYINGRAFKPDEWEEIGRPIIRIQNLTNSTDVCNRTTKLFEDKYLIKDGDLLFAWSASLGAHIWHGEEGWLNQHIFKVIPTPETDKMYLYYYLLHIVDQLYSKTHGSGMVHITLKPFKETTIYLPCIETQRYIVNRIESLFAKLDEAKEKVQAVVDSFETRKAAILHKAFSGELTTQWRKEHSIGLDSWEVILFGDLILDGPQNGLYKPKDAYGNGTKILRIDGFYDGYVEVWETLKRLALSDTEIKLYELHLDDIVINRVNSMPFLGKSALIRQLPETCVFESNMMRISLKKERVIPEFIIKYLNSPAGLLELRKNAKQAVNQASINQKDVKSVTVRLPSWGEQAEIVNILDNLFAKEQQAKESAEAVLEQIDIMKKTILARAFRGELGANDPAEENAVELLKSTL